VFPTLFFPATLSPSVALIASFSTFAVGLVARPFGAVMFGHLGDTIERKKALAAALVLMGMATTLMAVLPTYHTAGVFAPYALIVLRLLQGLAVGGQWGGATLLATKSAPPAKRGFYGSIAQCGVGAGVVLANIAFLAASSAKSAEAFLAYGWRIPFLLSVCLIGLAMYLHFRVDDTVAFLKAQSLKLRSPGALPIAGAQHTTGVAPPSGRSIPVLDALRRYPGRICLAAGVQVPCTLVFYVAITYVVAYGTNAAGLQLPRSVLLGAVMLASALALPVVPLSGLLSDRFGRRRVMTAGIALMAVWAFVLSALIETRSFLWIGVALTGSAAFNSMMYGPLAALYAEQFDIRVRYSAISLAYQLAAIVGGVFAPIIATGLYARFHTNMWMAGYVAASCVVALACLSRLEETAGKYLVVQDGAPIVPADA
jgi:MFS family permease